MSNYGPVSTLAYAAVVTWAFWNLWMTTQGCWLVPDIPPLYLFALCAVAARQFATMIHWRLT